MVKRIIIELSALIMFLLFTSQVCPTSIPILFSKSISQSIIIDDITLTSKDILDNKTGKKIAVEFYMQNNTEKPLRVSWNCKGAINTYIQSCKGTTDIPALTKIWVATVTPQEPDKSWEPGTLEFKWEQIN